MGGFDGKLLIGIYSLVSYVIVSEYIACIFKYNQIVPDLIPKAPPNLLKVTFDGYLRVSLGNELTPTEVKNQPQVDYAADESAFYTIMLLDPDAPSRAEPTLRAFKHWLVTNIPGVHIDEGDVLAAYVGSGPPEGTGFHRYTYLLYKQPCEIEFTERRVGDHSSVDRPNFSAPEFAAKYNLGDPVAGNFYLAQYDDYVPTVLAQLSGN